MGCQIMSVKLVHNVETGEVTEVKLTADEIAQIEKDKVQAILELDAQNAITVEKSALLDRLGITTDEAKLLLL